MVRRYSQYALIGLVALLVGCAQLGLATPETFNEKAAVAYATVTQVRETATALLQAKLITADDADNVLKSTDVAKTGVDTARTMHATDPNAANGKLEAIRVGLTALTTYLASRKK